jgi:hypothetical protein
MSVEGVGLSKPFVIVCFLGQQIAWYFLPLALILFVHIL